MRLIKYLFLPFVVTFLSCSENISPEEYYNIYKVVKINNIDIGEYKETYNGTIFPIEFQLIDPIVDFKGRVIFENLGIENLMKIISEDILEDIFYVDINDKIKGVEYVMFEEIEIDSTTIKGIFSFIGPTIDTRPNDFLAEKN